MSAGGTSVLAVAATFLPGDWGFFTSYLIGATSLVVVAIGSTAPGLLSAGITFFNSVFPDYRERIARHEAAHFLVQPPCTVVPTCTAPLYWPLCPPTRPRSS